MTCAKVKMVDGQQVQFTVPGVRQVFSGNRIGIDYIEAGCAVGKPIDKSGESG
ncbi:MAG TPA: hypothetical protein PK580_08615 [Nitrosomonas halophila]|nr:hypothetical protein [Nitrosomonas halophila]